MNKEAVMFHKQGSGPSNKQTKINRKLVGAISQYI